MANNVIDQTRKEGDLNLVKKRFDGNKDTRLNKNHSIKGTSITELIFKNIHFLVALIIKLNFFLKQKQELLK